MIHVKDPLEKPKYTASHPRWLKPHIIDEAQRQEESEIFCTNKRSGIVDAWEVIPVHSCKKATSAFRTTLPQNTSGPNKHSSVWYTSSEEVVCTSKVHLHTMFASMIIGLPGCPGAVVKAWTVGPHPHPLLEDERHFKVTAPSFDYNKSKTSIISNVMQRHTTLF